MTSIALTLDSLSNTKRALIEHFPKHKSSHLTESLAAACGYRTHAALLADLVNGDTADPDFVLLDDGAFLHRLSELGGMPAGVRRDGVFEALPYPSRADTIRTASAEGRKSRFTSLRDKAWRNLMVAAVNAGIDRRLFTVRPGDNRWPGAKKGPMSGRAEPFVYRFTIDNTAGIASVFDAGWDELSIHATLWPSQEAERWIRVWNAGFITGEANATGWLERREGAWLQVPRDRQLACKQARLRTVAELEIRPKGFADCGSFRF